MSSSSHSAFAAGVHKPIPRRARRPPAIPMQRPARAIPAAAVGTYNIHLDQPRQLIEGLGFEIQSDSIGSANQGLPELPHQRAPRSHAARTPAFLQGDVERFPLLSSRRRTLLARNRPREENAARSLAHPDGRTPRNDDRLRHRRRLSRILVARPPTGKPTSPTLAQKKKPTS